MRLRDLDQLATRQFGVIRRDQTSLTQSSWRRALDAGTLEPIHPQVARLVGTPRSGRQQIKAATLADPGSVASHRSAALLWGLLGRDPDLDHGPVHLTALEASRHRCLDGVTFHRPKDRVGIRPVTRCTMPVTPPVRTLIDLGITDPGLVHAAVGSALGSGLLTINGIEAGLLRHAAPGRHGVTALRTALDDWAIDALPADSVLEAQFRQLCEEHRLPRLTFHERIEGWEVDFRFVDTAVVVECDGWTTHGRQRDQFERDRRKDDDLRSAGWVVARFTYRAITRHPADTARRLRRLLTAWDDLPAPDRPAAA